LRVDNVRLETMIAAIENLPAERVQRQEFRGIGKLKQLDLSWRPSTQNTLRHWRRAVCVSSLFRFTA
jgi:hypothetical protein